ncbi:hypothetical protein BDV32DRAFT_149417 [Aspergillus pseudonomiae]|uniref:Uncharacterized protein n=1 Tax=Aspergillus pseudonomiae TaxID=1506151 RepID=A0A5N7DVF9_9EURO|nr:uncharacterized protein BDV37DRAFT_277833 [Aspergillus pseudonomiae]KAB8260449.1 hypothetical protein BDV32DRAFT_149417 [Aspergillus pseudonomiae]KAE8409488.1 hypothetical protein BDV37DRAFT_277833 [Aspergillus pseudonomiae]
MDEDPEITLPKLTSQLTTTPQAFPTCCLSISTPLLETLTSLLPKKPDYTVSIGSGSGLLEALLTHTNASLQIEGVEVNPAVNRYIAEQDMHVVTGTWDLLASRVPGAKAWMFVYPREPKLVDRYIEAFGKEGVVEVILWLGPRADWADYVGCLDGRGFGVERVVGCEGGLEGFEMLGVVRRVGSG